MIRSTFQGLLVGACLAVALLIPARAHADASQAVILMGYGGGYDGGSLPHCVQYFGTGKLFMYTCDNIFSQGTGYFLFDSNGAIHIEPDTGKCVDVTANVVPCNGSAAQQWYFANGLLRPRWSKQFQGCLTIESAPSPSLDGVLVDVAPCTATYAQLFVPVGVNMMFESPTTATCLYSSTAPFVPLKTGQCNSQAASQAFYFSFNNSSSSFYVTLETGAGDNRCVASDGTPGDLAYLDPNNCNLTSYNNPPFERWQYTFDQRLMNAQREGAHNHLCLSQGNQVPGTFINNVTESDCVAFSQPQKWIMWINGFPSTTLPLIRPPL